MPPDAAIFEGERARLTRVAYRMLGSVAEAEDVVQDAWLRWSTGAAPVANPAAWLTRVVTRLSLDQLKSARTRRESYVGAWLPEPLVGALDPPEATGDDLTFALMLALERLSPLERAAFLLHDVFDVPLEEVAVTLERDAGAVRQLAVRARRHVEAARPRYPVAAGEGERMARAFFSAAHEGDVAGLRALLADDVVARSDGGGRVIAFLNPIVGAPRVVRAFAGIRRKFGNDGARLLRVGRIDGLPGYVSIERGAVLQTTALAIEAGRIREILIVRNPDKLRHVAALLSDDPPA